ncbi:MAG: hypothetical protein AAF629_34180, partial [Chloroflexota bacterium]
RVTKLEDQGPILKTRISDSYITTKPPAAPKPQRRIDDDTGEDEAIAGGKWAKVVKTKPCNRLSITKTRKRDAWKVLLYMPGLRRPATFIGWDGADQIVDFFGEVAPWLTMDHFDETAWTEVDDGQGSAKILHSEDVNFLVDWFKTSPNTMGQTFVNIEAVYPLDE